MGILKTWITKNNGIEIIQLLNNRCNCYLLQKNGTSVLVDTSVHREASTMQHRLADLQVDTLACILLTHAHFDHAANAAPLQQQFNCPIYAHSSEAPFLREGHSHLPKGTNPLTKVVIGLAGDRVLPMHKFPPCNGTILTELSDNRPDNPPNNPPGSPPGRPTGNPPGNPPSELAPLFQQLQLKVLHTPGHTAGSVSYLVDNQIALVGDAMVNPFHRHIFPPFANNPQQLPATWQALLNTGCSTFLPAHGTQIPRALLQRSLTNIR